MAPAAGAGAGADADADSGARETLKKAKLRHKPKYQKPLQPGVAPAMFKVPRIVRSSSRFLALA